MKKYFLLTVLAVVTMGLFGGCSNNDDTSDSSASQSSSSSEMKADNADQVMQDFDSITLGDAENKGEGGTAKTEVEQFFGKVSEEDKCKAKEITTDVITWDKPAGAKSIVISFIDDKVVGKSIDGLETADEKELSKAQFDDLKTDGSYTKEMALEQLGKPEGIGANRDSDGMVEIYNWNNVTDENKKVITTIEFVDGNAKTKNQTDRE